jgi:hypothetical protein
MREREIDRGETTTEERVRLVFLLASVLKCGEMRGNGQTVQSGQGRFDFRSGERQRLIWK